MWFQYDRIRRHRVGDGEVGGLGDRAPFDAGVGGDDELGNAFAGLEGEGGLSVVDEQDPDFTAVVRVNGSRAIQDGQAMFEGEATARTDLRFVSIGQLDVQSGGHKASLAGLQDHGSFEAGAQVESGALGRGVCGQGVLSDVGHTDHDGGRGVLAHPRWKSGLRLLRKASTPSLKSGCSKQRPN